MIKALLDLSGPTFLFVYVVSMIGALFLSAPMRKLCHSLHRRDDTVGGAGLTPYELAYLAGGKLRAIQAALASLAHRGILKATSDGQGLEVESALPQRAHPLETGLYREIQAGNSRSSAWAGLSLNALNDIEDRVRTAGYSPSAGEIRCLRWMGSLPLLAVTLMGIVRAVVGVSRDRPIGFLVALLVVSLVILLIKLTSAPTRTERGESYLRGLQRRNAALESTAMRRSTELSQADLMLGVALFGAAALGSGAGALAWMKPVLFPDSVGSGANGSSSSCSSGGGGSSCGSSCGGGCGGGGCGG